MAICGRTGSGKSSLVGFLLKLLDPTPSCPPEDSATIDGIPLARINRQTLRQRIIAVPQEAVFLPEGCSFRENLDPTGVSRDGGECEDVLQKIGLWDFVRERGGLDAGMSPNTLSAGQRQLFSLGRALLRRRERSRLLLNTSLSAPASASPSSASAGRGIDPNPPDKNAVKTQTMGSNEHEKPAKEGGILLLDEVSSSVDHETERLMQEIIRQEFRGYTVVAVSHRLDMIMDFDRVVVMDTGRIVEVGNPLQLSGTEGSRFGELVEASRS